MKKLHALLLSATLITASSLPAMATEDSGISVIQTAPAESTGSIAPSGLAGGLGALSSTQLILLGLVLVGGAAALGDGGGGSSSPSGTQ